MCSGCCCCCCRSNEEGQDNENDISLKSGGKRPLLKRHNTFYEETKTFSLGAQAVTVQLRSCRNLPLGDPFVEISCSLIQNSKQRSHEISNSSNPVFAPPFRAIFSPLSEIECERGTGRIIFSVMDRKKIGAATCVADGIVKISDIPMHDNFKHVFVPLFDARTGERIDNATCEIEIKIDSAFKAAATKVEQVYQFERWLPRFGWSNNLLLTDPGAWRHEGRKDYSSTFEDCIHDLQEGWEVQQQWQIFSRPLSEKAWEYSWGFRFSRWFEEPFCFMRVRRRIWRRVIHKIGVDIDVEDAEC